MAKESNTTEKMAHKVLVEPIITEASTAAAQLNKYIFKVTRNADKRQIKRAIKELYSVDAISVRTINVSGKKRMRGRIEGKTASYKKAIVTVKEGESIDIFGNK